MTSELQTRTEHSRSIEDAEKFRAIETLKSVGLLIPLGDIETYHGRVGYETDEVEWSVDPSFANASNDSGNNNVNNRPSLYTGEEKVAADFAFERGRSIIRKKYNQYFEQKVRDYTPDQRQEWLERENQRQQDWWATLTPDHREYYPAGPKVYTLDTFDVTDGWIRTESRHLRDLMPKDEQQAIWTQFADGLRAEVHEIVTADTDATILDFSFNEKKLDDEQRKSYHQALKALALPITEGSPVSFNDRDAVKPFVETLKQSTMAMIYNDDIEQIARDAGIDERVVLQLASAYNARQIALTSPAYLASELIKRPADIHVDTMQASDGMKEVPINLEYVQRFLREAHIVGVLQKISSATLNRDIGAVSFIDLEKTSTANGLESERSATWQRLGSLATSLSRSNNPEIQSTPSLQRLLENAYAKPSELVSAAMQVDGYADLFKADAGNWEGYTLAEHTETVLRNFDESFADRLPVELLAPMRLAILAHDTGKPIATARGDKRRQAEYNAVQANDFLTKLGTDDKLKGLLLAVMGRGEELAFELDIRNGGEAVQRDMQAFATEALQRFYDSEDVTDEQIVGFIEMCRILQQCDGGAYTSMAITRRQNNQGRYRNAPSFNQSFAQPMGFGKRTIRLRQPGDNSAASNLAPTSIGMSSRLKISHQGAGRRPPQLP